MSIEIGKEIIIKKRYDIKSHFNKQVFVEQLVDIYIVSRLIYQSSTLNQTKAIRKPYSQSMVLKIWLFLNVWFKLSMTASKLATKVLITILQAKAIFPAMCEN